MVASIVPVTLKTLLIKSPALFAGQTSSKIKDNFKKSTKKFWMYKKLFIPLHRI